MVGWFDIRSLGLSGEEFEIRSEIKERLLKLSQGQIADRRPRLHNFMSGHIRRYCQNSNGKNKAGRRQSHSADEALRRKLVKEDTGGYKVVDSAW